jgi:hypothetical protein
VCPASAHDLRRTAKISLQIQTIRTAARLSANVVRASSASFKLLWCTKATLRPHCLNFYLSAGSADAELPHWGVSQQDNDALHMMLAKYKMQGMNLSLPMYIYTYIYIHIYIHIHIQIIYIWLDMHALLIIYTPKLTYH